MNISNALNDAARRLSESGIETAQLDAEVLLAHALGTSRAELYLRRGEPIYPEVEERFISSVNSRCGGRPVAYITGVKEFWSIPIRVTPDVLIPRPETETVVERALATAREAGAKRILDICTGSGCIAAALSSELPNARICVSDISEAALRVARENLSPAGEGVDFLLGDLFAPVEGHFDLITANPPYIADGDLASLPRDIRGYEPMRALAAGPDGLDFIGRIINDAPDHLAPGGWLVMEVGAGQAPAAATMALASDRYDTIGTARDLAGIERVVTARRSLWKNS